ncbi:MAG: hypothetical protein JO302_05875 [Candidatus Eremiobacteraeota bacterium]|nr:hypothetical protein [Candidatus Eremiobacteraeota bacterium]
MIIPFPVTTVIAQAAPAPPPAPAPAAPATTSGSSSKSAPATKAADPAAVAKNAGSLLHQLQTGTVDRTALDAKMSAALTDAQLSQIKGQLGPLGDPVSVTPTGSNTQNGLTVYTYNVDFKSGSLTEYYVLDADGKVAGVWFKPAASTSTPP